MSVNPKQIENEIQAQNWSGARTDLIQYTQEHPQSAKAWYYLAQVDAKTGQMQEAREAMHKADTIDPNHTFVGNLKAYSQLEHNLNANQNPQPVPTPARTYAIQQPVAVPQPHKDNTTLWVVLGLSLIAVMIIVWALVARSNRKAREERERLQERLDEESRRSAREREEVRRSIDALANSRQTSQSASFGAAYGGSTRTAQPIPPSPVPPVAHAYGQSYGQVPAYGQSSPPVTVVNNSGVGGVGPGYYGHNDGMLTGLILGEMISDSHHDHYVERDHYSAPAPAPAPSPSFDWGNSSSSSSSSSDSSFDYGSSSSDWSSSSSDFSSSDF